MWSTESWLPGTQSQEVRDYEVRNAAVARRAAAEGMVLLKNEGNLLPIAPGTPLALYGAGAVETIKGGSGSGDVNSRETVSVWQGLERAGYTVTTTEWLSAFRRDYRKAREAWRDEIWRKLEDGREGGMRFFDAYAGTPFHSPKGGPIEKTEAETALYVIRRTAGEGADRYFAEGDYLLTEDELADLRAIAGCYSRIVLVLNIGGLIDLGILDELPEIRAVIYMQQPGMEAGNALADLIGGAVNPSGKLTDTWPLSYADYPNAATFSHNNGDVQKEYYTEDLFVGYRYFDTFEKPVRFDFGFGLSYTAFEIRTVGITHYNLGTAEPEIGVRVRVTNTGAVPGREVVQVYAAVPQGRLPGEYRRLAAFRKTEELQPGETGEYELRFGVRGLAAYDEALPGYVLKEGTCGLFVGSSLGASVLSAVLRFPQEIIIERTMNICPVRESYGKLQAPAERTNERRGAWEGETAGLPDIYVNPQDVVCLTHEYDGAYLQASARARDFVDTLTREQLIRLATGDVNRSQSSALGSAGSSVPGAAAQTSACAEEQGLPFINLADGPAGLRLNQVYPVADGKPVRQSFTAAIENGFLSREEPPAGEVRYQYCTAFPVGTLLAQTWDPALVAEVGRAVAEELELFRISLWLAPGMNIHRNPLCGRNFEYYSEDPLLSGKIAAAMTKGVQSRPGCGTTIKHFACNNQEDNRKGSDSVVSERALREIYLKGFEIAVKESDPYSIMTSYNLVNGVHAANSADLCTNAARCEWGWKGLIMTDWTTTHDGPACTASGCMRAGNDIVMPGRAEDHENMAAELEAGSLPEADLKRCVARLVDCILRCDPTCRIREEAR